MTERLIDAIALRRRAAREIRDSINGYLIALQEMTFVQSQNDAEIARLEKEIQNARQD